MKEAGKSKMELALNYFMRHGKAYPGTESLLPPGLVKAETKPDAGTTTAAAGDDRPYVPVDFAASRRALKKPPKPGYPSALTPSVGMMISAGEDYLRSTLVDRIDRWYHRWGVVAALCLNPTRSVSNVIAFQKPWADPPWLTLRREERAREAARSLSRPPSATTQVR